MNQIRAIQALNKREIENGVPPEASWHADYRDTAFVYFGGMPYELTEGDVIAIFSQFGEPVFLKLVRDKETGKSKGFGWLKYEDQRSTDLAVDNLGGTDIGGRLIRVDHARYKARDDEDLDECRIGWEDMLRQERAEKGLPPSEDGDATDDEKEEAARRIRPVLKEERELQLLIDNHDDEDPMKEFLINEKKKEVEDALRREKRRAEKDSRKHRDQNRHRHHRSHRSRREDSADEGHRRDREHRDRDVHDVDRKSRSKRDELPLRRPA
ncbi:RNA-binding domain-containing protein [Parathielavia hyrcaniae]|uniref:RNA-binding domain-containing protein n=1 Tax=Parathielavia hyrcaniae TaxID=113614 RepID=A0AAN6T2Z7_9PEZI|nr:RNA-binding domain-containing protein [Parathielavia hyrcaniae]